MIRFISSLLLILGNAVAQFRDPITLRPTIGPLITPNTIAPVRTIVPIRTIVPSSSTTIINNVVKIDLNIENRIDDSNEVENNNNESNQPINRLPSNNSESISNHIYEEVDYEARYEMPSLANVNYENIAKESDYGRQVTTIV